MRDSIVRDDLKGEHQRLKAQTLRSLLQLMESEFTLADTMTDLAETELEMGNLQHGRGLLDKVIHAIMAARKRLAEADLSEAEKAKVAQPFAELEPRLDGIRKRLGLAA